MFDRFRPAPFNKICLMLLRRQVALFNKILYLVAAMPLWAIYSRDFVFLPEFLNAKKQNLP
ncbi:MAG: hypothetical protein DRP87_18645 [Spirochaetes bacterium]|nr:MAG: hypothetical protein DRP87_18645 [Spirochaetota bacterium]